MPYTVPVGIGTIIGAGTPGSVLFVGANGELAQDNANFFYDNANNQLLGGNGSANNPFYAFVNDPDTGLYRATSNVMVFATNGAARVAFSGNLSMSSGVELGWTNSSSDPTTGRDTILARDAANVLAQRNGTNAQTHRIYNTFTDAANYERTELTFITNEPWIRSQSAGTGVSRAMRIGTMGASNVTLVTSGNFRWHVNSSGHFLCNDDNTYDVGVSGANRPRTIYVGTSVQIEANNGLKLTTQTNGAGAGAGTLGNAPAAGNPAFWLPVTVNGVNRHIPCW